MEQIAALIAIVAIISIEIYDDDTENIVGKRRPAVRCRNIK